MKIWCLDFRDDRYTDAVMQNHPLGLNPFRGTKLVEKISLDAVARIRSRRPPTDFFKVGLLWIISSKLQSILASHKVDGEFLPIRLCDRKGVTIDGHWFCFNTTLILDWFDRRSSRFTDNQGFATNIRRVAVDPNKFGDFPLSAARKTNPVLVGVRDDVAASIVFNGCSGVVFCEPQEWHDPIDPVP